jgi:hypothetical protein
MYRKPLGTVVCASRDICTCCDCVDRSCDGDGFDVLAIFARGLQDFNRAIVLFSLILFLPCLRSLALSLSPTLQNIKNNSPINTRLQKMLLKIRVSWII